VTRYDTPPPATGRGSYTSLPPAIPAPVEIVGLASTIVPALLGLLFWAFTLRTIVEGIQVYLYIEENTRRTAEAAES